MKRSDAYDRLHLLMERAVDMMPMHPRDTADAYASLQSLAVKVLQDDAAPWWMIESYAALLLDRLSAMLDDIERGSR